FPFLSLSLASLLLMSFSLYQNVRERFWLHCDTSKFEHKFADRHDGFAIFLFVTISNNRCSMMNALCYRGARLLPFPGEGTGSYAKTTSVA
ncbi:MAG: hypothetical protein WCD86_13130, partial [Ktedonobacteraceae bacterium]